MQSSTIIVLLCLIAAVAAHAHYERYPAVEAVQLEGDAYESLSDTPAHERSPRTKRGFLLLKKKLLLGALGLKAAKVGAVGVAGALALKKSSVPKTHKIKVIDAYNHQTHYGYRSQGPAWNVDVHSWH